MRRRNVVGILLSGFALSLLLVGPVSAAGKGTKRKAGVVLFQEKPNAGNKEKASLQAALAKYGIKLKKKHLKGKLSEGNASNAGGASEEEIAAALVATGAVAFAEPDYLIPLDETGIAAVPNDPSYGSQWQHSKINSPGAWDIETGDSNVLIAVCDTGVQDNHPDLAANMQLPGLNTVDGSTNTSDDHGHGTFVAGCMGAVGNNGIGVSGVAWNIKILPIRITNRQDGSAYFSDMVEGIQHAADNGAKVVNLSYGGAYSSTIANAGQYIRDRGGLLFMAAGNDGHDGDNGNPVYPDFTSFVQVGATSSSDTKASWSNYGAFIDIVAPGVSVYSTRKGSGYGSGSGTSFASPIAAGLAALVYSVDPNFSPDQVETFIFSTAVDLGNPGEDALYGSGRIDAAAAIAMASSSQGNANPTAAASANPTTTNIGQSVSFDGSGSSDSDGLIVSYSWNFGDGSSGSGATTSHSYSSVGTYTATLTVTDNGGGTDTDSVTITVEDPNALNAPTNLSASLSGSTVNLSWSHDNQNQTGFLIQRGLKVKKNVNWSDLAVVGASDRSYADTGVDSGTYRYRVRAFNNVNNTAFSNEVQIKVGGSGGGGGGNGGGGGGKGKPKR